MLRIGLGTILAVLAIWAVAGCGTPDPAETPPDGATPGRDAPSNEPDRRMIEAPGAWRVFATGETRGHLKPCQCSQGQLGGMTRRELFLDRVRDSGDLVLDLGNAAAGAGPLRRIRLESTLEALITLRYGAFVPGELEATDADTLADVAANSPLPIVTANLRRTDGSRPFAGHVLLPGPGGRTWGVVGLTRPVRPLPDGWEFEDAGAALRREVTAAARSADFVVVGSSWPAAELRPLLAGLPVGLALAPADREADARASATDFAHTALPDGATPVVEVAQFAAYVRCFVRPPDGPATTWRHWLADDVPGARDTTEILRRFRERSVAGVPHVVTDLLRSQLAAGFAGSASCRECHADEFTQWADSRHAHAMDTLVRKDAARDPNCVGCHLVDVPDATGAADLRAAQADRLGIGCEACHGPRTTHIERARSGVQPPGGAPGWSARSVCTGCHHPPEVLEFDADAAWHKIRHGKR